MSFFANLLGEVESKQAGSSSIPPLTTDPSAKRVSRSDRPDVRNGSSTVISPANAPLGSVALGSPSGPLPQPDKVTIRSNGMGSSHQPSNPGTSTVQTGVKRKAEGDNEATTRLTKSPKVSRTQAKPSAPSTVKVPSLAVLAKLTSARTPRTQIEDDKKAKEEQPQPVTSSTGPRPTQALAGKGIPQKPLPLSKVTSPSRDVSPAKPEASKTGSKNPALASARTKPTSGPAKGSFMELLARAEASKNHTTVGSIVNKPREVRKVGPKQDSKPTTKPSVGNAKSETLSKNGHKSDSRPRLPSPPVKKATPDPEAERKSKALAYKGTMGLGRPSTSHPPLPSRAGRDGLGSRTGPGRRYQEYDDDESNSEYDSDDSAAMEVSAFDVEREEKRSLEAAIRDDWEEQQREMMKEKAKLQRKSMATKR